MGEKNYQPNLKAFFSPRNAVFAVLVIVYLYTVFFTYIHNRNSEGYILGDWLINYEDGGFKRRGLSGSIFFILQDITGLSLNTLVYVAQFFIITFFFYIFYRIIKLKEVSWLYLSLVLSSVGFVGLLNNVSYVGKKEFILFAIFAYYNFLLFKEKLTNSKEWLICFLLMISTLMHEITLFFIPYFLVSRYLFTKNKKGFAKYLLAVFVPAIAIILFGKNINEGQSLEILKARGVVFSDGILFWNLDEKQVLIDRLHHLFPYLIGFVLSAIHVYYYLRNQLQKERGLGLALAVTFLFSLPLFYLGLDWGRWLYVHVMMIIILFGTLLPIKKLEPEFSLSMKNRSFLIPFLIIVFSLIYRVELSGLFTFEGLFYRVFIVPTELLHKMI